MKNSNRLLLLACLLIFAGKATAQMSGTSVFLQGNYLEIGEQGNGSFGAGGIPAGYHPHLSTAGGGTYLAEVYDWGHDGWAVGAPNYMGDYTYPGSPFEGWELQIGTGRSQAFQGSGTGYVTGGTGAGLAGTVTGYSTAGASARSIWTGTATGLTITQETRVDQLSSSVVVTTVLKNISALIVPQVYYMRSCDPDNDQTWSGGGFPTNNTIVHQNEDARHMVMVKAIGQGYPAAAYLALATKDCRAKGFIYDSWSLSSGVDLGTTWNGTYAGATYNLGGTRNGDIAIGLTYNIGDIAPGDSALISYAYVFNGDNGIDSAFPDPQIVINGTPHPTIAPPTPNYDTFNVCLYPGMTTLPVDIRYATDKDWSWSHWTWTPGLGLASTTGTTNTINTTVLPASITYTITGTDSASGMSSCNRKIFYLTIFTCNNAVCNSPCVGDTLKFNAPGDSTGATYVWFGPAPSTAVFSTSQSNYKFPAAMTDTGTYTCIKYVGGFPVDTGTCTAVIHPLPNLLVTSNQALCQPIVGTLVLSDSADVPCTTYTWTGPLGYTATNAKDTIYGFDSSMAGTYYVQTISTFGCKNNGSVDVFPGVVPEFDTIKHPGCPYDSVEFINLTTNANTYEWNFHDGSTDDFNRNPAEHIFMLGHNIYTVTLTAHNPNCTAAKTHTIDLRHTVTADFSVTDTICNNTALNIADLSTATLYGSPVTPLYSHAWRYGDGGTDSSNGTPATQHTYTMEGIYPVTLVVTDSLHCVDSVTKNMYILQPYMHTVSDTMFCLLNPLPLYNNEWVKPDHIVDAYGFTYSWTPSTYLSSGTAQIPTFNAVGVYTYNLTATLDHFGCTVSHDIVLNSILPATLHNVTANTTITLGSSVYMNADSELFYTWIPNDGSLSNPSINNPVATPSVTTTYTVYGMDYYGCRDTATVTITVDTTEHEIVPSGFTPNGDGLNDVFHVGGIKFQRLVEMRVFNRWGECVFSTNDREKGWDGTYKGVPQDMGVYNYTIIVAKPGYGDNNNIIYKGTVTLIR